LIEKEKTGSPISLLVQDFGNPIRISSRKKVYTFFRKIIDSVKVFSTELDFMFESTIKISNFKQQNYD